MLHSDCGTARLEAILRLDGRNLKLAKIDFRAFGLQQDFAGQWIDFGDVIDGLAVDLNGQLIAVGDALDFGPLADRAFDVVPAASVEVFLEVPVVLVPPELAASGRKRLFLTALFPAMAALVWREFSLGDEMDGNLLAFRIIAADQDQIAHAA